MQDSLVLVFLGNPGREYATSRHNVAWMVCEAFEHLMTRQGSSLGILPSGSLSWSDKFDGSLSSLTLKGRKIHLFKPTTFMNLSGQPVRKLLDFFKLDIGAVVAVHDDLELEFGQISFRSGGGAGGHNGLRSLDSQSGGPGYLRLRIGIGRPKHGSVADYVLARFTVDEEAVLSLILDKASEMLITIMAGGKVPVGKLQAIQATPEKR